MQMSQHEYMQSLSTSMKTVDPAKLTLWTEKEYEPFKQTEKKKSRRAYFKSNVKESMNQKIWFS